MNQKPETKKIETCEIRTIENGVVLSTTVKSKQPYFYEYKQTHFGKMEEAIEYLLKLKAGYDSEYDEVAAAESEENVTELAGGECPF